MDSESDERLARLVHGAVLFGASAAEAARMSAFSARVLRLAVTYVDPSDDSAPTDWVQVLKVLEDAIRLAQAH